VFFVDDNMRNCESARAAGYGHVHQFTTVPRLGRVLIDERML
jgi:FMN phosphatase YigB (HAD superfamily)